MRIIYFGTPQFAAEILSFLVNRKVDIVAIVTKPDKPKGRSGDPQPSPVKNIAKQLLPGIPVYQPLKASSPDFAQLLEKYHADLFVVVAYGEIIKQNLLKMPRLGCINVHASLLPKYRGAAPIQWSIINGEKETGITIMHMALKMDAGNIIKHATVSIDENMNAGQLERKLCESAKAPLLEVIYDFEKGQIAPMSQDETQVTYASKLELEDCEVRWDLPAPQIHNLVRGTQPFPGAWCWVTIRGEKKRMKLIETQALRELNDIPGKILSYSKEGIEVACKQGTIKILELQLEGKRAMRAEAFVQGIRKEEITFII